MNRVIVFVFDGLQLSQVTPDLMPNLSAFAAAGVRFTNHHSVFPTVTRVNAASITTGCYPGRHGLAGNEFVDRRFDAGRVLPALRDELKEMFSATGKLLLVSNLAGTLAAHGEQYVAVATGSSGNGFIHNPHAAEVGGATIHPEFCEPMSLHEEILARYGEWPGSAPLPPEPRIARGVEVFAERVLDEMDPAVALFWSLEPDVSHHDSGVGSEVGNRGLEAADRQFARLIEWLDRKGRLSRTDILVATDHGYGTAKEIVNAARLVEEAGFPPTGEKGGVMVASNGGSVLYYVGGHDRETADRLAAWLMEKRWCGALVASEASGRPEGTLPASLVGQEGERAPDLAMSFVWDSKPNADGYPGRIYNTSKEPGQGNHGSMSRYEQRCAFIARGPSFKSGVSVDTPSGNVDVMPTILRLLGIDPLEPVDGRVLEEGLHKGLETLPHATQTHWAERPLGGKAYRQAITVSTVGSTFYVDEGCARRGPP